MEHHNQQQQQSNADMHAAISQPQVESNTLHAQVPPQPTSHQYPPSSISTTVSSVSTLPSPQHPGRAAQVPSPPPLPPTPPPFRQRAMSTVSTERPRSIIEVAVNTGTANPAGRQVRIQWLNEARARWDSLPRTSVIYLSYKTVMTLAKLVTTITLLAMTQSHMDCSLLGLMMILYMLHAVIDYPFAIMRQLHPIRLNQPLSPQQRLMLHEKSLMEVLGTCLFFVSNYFLFQSADCRRSVPPFFYGLLSYVIVDYVGILIPLILCLAAIFCMPFLIRVLTSLDIALGLAGPTGATEDLINTIPVVKYRKPVSVPTTATAAAAASVTLPPPAVLGQQSPESTSSTNPTRQDDTAITMEASESSAVGDAGTSQAVAGTSATAAGKQKQKQWRLDFGFRRKGSGKSDPSSQSSSSSSSSSSPSPKNDDEYLTLEDEQDATCSICLCEYEDEEELRKMPCLHYFHKACVDEWLKLHKSCPLCKREIDEGSEERSRSRRSPPQPSQPLIF